METGTCRRVFEGHTFSVNAVDLSPDGRWAVSASDDSTIRLWHLSSGRCRRILRGHTGPVNAVCFSSDGRRLLSGSQDGTMRLWERKTGACVRVFCGHARAVLVHGVNAVDLSTDGRWALSGGADKTIRLWEVDSGRCLCTIPGHRESVNAVHLSAHGNKAISGSSDGFAAVLTLPPAGERYCHFQVARPKSYAEVMEVQHALEKLLSLADEAYDQAQYPQALAYLREARQLPGCERAAAALDRWRTISLVCSRTGLRSIWLQRTFQAFAACFSPDGRQGLSVEDSGVTHCWQVHNGARVRSFDEPASASQFDPVERGWALGVVLCCRRHGEGVGHGHRRLHSHPGGQPRMGQCRMHERGWTIRALDRQRPHHRSLAGGDRSFSAQAPSRFSGHQYSISQRGQPLGSIRRAWRGWPLDTCIWAGRQRRRQCDRALECVYRRKGAYVPRA